MEEKALFEFAREHGWHRMLKLMERTHSLSEIAGIMNKEDNSILIDCRVMCAMGLLRLVRKEDDGGYAYMVTDLGMKFLKAYE